LNNPGKWKGKEGKDLEGQKIKELTVKYFKTAVPKKKQ
jgi:hypothetical protein